MAPFSVIVFGVVMWTIAVSGAKTAPFSFENGLVRTGPNCLCVCRSKINKTNANAGLALIYDRNFERQQR